MFNTDYVITLRLVHTILSAGELGQDTEGAGLGGAGSRVPVLCVLNQTLLAGVTGWGHVVHLRLQTSFPVQPDQPRNNDNENICVLNIQHKVYQ